ncbi:MAG: ABC transporter permease [bacterium]|nr:ABC transporter permease [bacterium]
MFKLSSFSFETFIALRYLRSKRKEVFISIITIISVVGVAVSVAVLNVVLSIMTGFTAEFQKKIVNSTAHIVVRAYGGNFAGWEEVVDAVEKQPGIEIAFPYTYDQAMLQAGSESRGIIVRGIPNDSGSRGRLSSMLQDKTTLDRLFAPVAVETELPQGGVNRAVLPGVIIGEELRKRLALEQGSLITLLSARFHNSPRGLVPSARRFVVLGTYKSGLAEFESSLIYVSMSDAQNFFGNGSTVTGVEAVISDVAQAPRIGIAVAEELQKLSGRYYVVDWTQPNKPLWDALNLEKQVYYIVLLLLILVASFSIISTMVMIVMEKSRDIAVFKVFGATDGDILRIFLTQGMIIGLSGTVSGTVLGYLGAIGLREFGFGIDPRVFSMDKVPVYLDMGNFFLVAVSAFLITSAAGIYPAIRASRLKPADALRYE